MSTSFPVVKCSIEILDRTLYAAREIGDLVDSGDYILNTALYYGLGFISGQYVNIDNTPHYLQDSSEIYKKIYITPASMESTDVYLRTFYGIEIKRSENSKIPPKLGGHSTSQWNARPHLYAVKNWNAKDKDYPYKGKNLPQFGRERVIDQQNLFTSFIFPYEITADEIVSKIPRYMRVGKKRSKVRVKAEVFEAFLEDGEFISNHPFGIYDYEGLPVGDLISVRMRPIPLIVQGRYKGKFVRIPHGKGKSDVILPYKLELLKVKR
jgi:CRISPR-associated protein Csc1